MTATALAHLPAFDQTQRPRFDDFEGPSISTPGVPSRPALRLVQPSPAHARAPRDLARLELHRRRRFIALLIATIAVVVVSQLAGVSLTTFGPAGAATVDPSLPVVHTVIPGDSYGSIATSLGLPDPAAAADRLRVANGGGELVVGQRLVFSTDQLQAWGSASSKVPHEDEVVGQ